MGNTHEAGIVPDRPLDVARPGAGKTGRAGARLLGGDRRGDGGRVSRLPAVEGAIGSARGIRPIYCSVSVRIQTLLPRPLGDLDCRDLSGAQPDHPALNRTRPRLTSSHYGPI